VVPADAVVRFDNKHYIFAATAPDTFEMVQVEPGTTEAGYMELTGSSETALRSRPIVLKNAYTLLMKMKNTTE
jgi:cobalt-zinc-cadmium efflux system membrane fusion protein